MKLYPINSVNAVPSFGAMKSSQFKGVDYICMRKLKAPIEKFDTNRDMQNWAFQKIMEFAKMDFPGRSKTTSEGRKDMINQWLAGMLNKEDKKYPCAFCLVMLKEILSKLKPNNDDLPEVFNYKALGKTFEEIRTRGEDTGFRFMNVYSKNLKSLYSEPVPDNDWVVIKSLANDPMNYEDNITKLQLLSHRTWCTKTSYAKVHLLYGDFHALMKDGKPRVMLRVMEDILEEIQSVGNDGLHEDDYQVVKDYVDKNKFELSDAVYSELRKFKSIQ